MNALRNASLLSAFLLLLPLALVAQNNSASGVDWSLVGTWINPAYDQAIFPARWVYNADGTLVEYKTVSGQFPYRGTYVVEKSWEENGFHSFRVVVHDYEVSFMIVRLSNGGQVFESTMTHGDYPLKFDPKSTSCYYEIRYRQP